MLQQCDDGRRENTFDAAFDICAPCNQLILDITFSISNDHRDPGIRKVGYTFVPNDGDEFRAWVAGGEGSDVLECTIAMGDARSVDINI